MQSWKKSEGSLRDENNDDSKLDDNAGDNLTGDEMQFRYIIQNFGKCSMRFKSYWTFRIETETHRKHLAYRLISKHREINTDE